MCCVSGETTAVDGLQQRTNTFKEKKMKRLLAICTMLAIVLAANNFVLAFIPNPPPDVPTLYCIGFEPPLDRGPVEVHKNRALPLKAILEYEDGYLVTETDIDAPPVIQITFQPEVGYAEDVTDEALFAGQGTDGNQFVFTGSNLQFNLMTKSYSSPGTYTITMVSGDESYVINDNPDNGPICEAQFVIE